MSAETKRGGFFTRVLTDIWGAVIGAFVVGGMAGTGLTFFAEVMRVHDQELNIAVAALVIGATAGAVTIDRVAGGGN